MMEYEGRYKSFDNSVIETYDVATRANKVKLSDLAGCDEVLAGRYDVGSQDGAIGELASAIVRAREDDKAVMWFTGAHMIKNGLGPILIDLVGRGLITMVSGNGAVAIHDFELALIGQTSEDVPDALGKGRFGMARELGYINAVLSEADQRCMGFGEGVGRVICDDEFRRAVAVRAGGSQPIEFQHKEVSVAARCYESSVPLTIHAGIGTDVTDQHANFDGRAKGGCSGRDFLVLVNEVVNLAGGGVFLNVGSAVAGPEVLLKAVSMAGNTGRPPEGLITADFDLREYHRQAMSDESTMHYYYRDHKSVVTRIPQALGGRGYYVQGDQRRTIPRLYQQIIALI